jgi:hypothetical protein
MMRLPGWTFTRLIIGRSLIVWFGVRLSMLGLGSGLDLDYRVSLLVVLVAMGLATFEGRRLNEHLFLGNLGVPISALIVMAAIPPLILEVVLGLVGPGSRYSPRNRSSSRSAANRSSPPPGFGSCRAR